MRLRNNPEAKEILEKSDYVIKERQANYFDNDNEVQIEIGMGKGDFIVGMALLHPDVNFIGIEKFGTVLVKALEKIEQLKLTNVKIINNDATELLEYFKPHSIGCIYLNFSDPWPKKRHYKRRLTYKSFLKLYKKLLVKNGLIKQKTDNKLLFTSSLLSFNNYPMIMEYVSVDLHSDEKITDNVMSEYEQKFAGLGQPIYSVWTRFKR